MHHFILFMSLQGPLLQQIIKEASIKHHKYHVFLKEMGADSERFDKYGTQSIDAANIPPFLKPH